MYVLWPEDKVIFLEHLVTGSCETVCTEAETEFRFSERIATALNC